MAYRQKIEHMDFYLLDSRLSSVSLLEAPYLPTAFHARPAEYTPPSGIYLTLYGRAADGRSVVVETPLTEGLSLAFLTLHATQSETSGDAEIIIDELLERSSLELSADDLEANVEERQREILDDV